MAAMNVRLLVARKAGEWSQKQLAFAAGLSQSDVSRIERGWVPPIPVQEQLAAVLGVPRDALFGSRASAG